MRQVAILALIALCLGFFPGQATSASNEQTATVGESEDISLYYLDQARYWRDSGRYELSRQAYAQALSTCRNNANLEIIKRELEGVELLIRTMR